MTEGSGHKSDYKGRPTTPKKVASQPNWPEQGHRRTEYHMPMHSKSGLQMGANTTHRVSRRARFHPSHLATIMIKAMTILRRWHSQGRMTAGKTSRQVGPEHELLAWQARMLPTEQPHRGQVKGNGRGCKSKSKGERRGRLKTATKTVNKVQSKVALQRWSHFRPYTKRGRDRFSDATCLCGLPTYRVRGSLLG